MNAMQNDAVGDARLNLLGETERRGSRPRCVLLTDDEDTAVAARLTTLIAPFGFVDAARHTWAPAGFRAPSEVELGQAAQFLPPDVRRTLKSWWLAVEKRAKTPT